MKQLTMKLPEETHRTLKMIAAATGKTMTDLVIEWINKAKEAVGIIDPFINQLKSMPITHEEISPETMAEIKAAMAEKPEGPYEDLSKELSPRKKK